MLEIAKKGQLTTHKNYDLSADLKKIENEVMSNNANGAEISQANKVAEKRKR